MNTSMFGWMLVSLTKDCSFGVLFGQDAQPWHDGGFTQVDSIASGDSEKSLTWLFRQRPNVMSRKTHETP